MRYSYSGYREDAKAFYYIKDATLYMVKDGNTRVIAENVAAVSGNELYE